MFNQLPQCIVKVSTDDEEDLHQDVAHTGRIARRRAAVLPYLYCSEANIVGHSDGHIEGSQQDQPIPPGLEGAVVKEDEARLLDVGHLVFWYWVCIGAQDTLVWVRQEKKKQY